MSASLRRFGWAAYDHLGGLVLLNLVWSVLALPWLVSGVLAVGWGLARGPVPAAVAIVAATGWVACSPPTALLFVAAARWLADAPVTARALLSAGGQAALRAQVAGLVHVAAAGVLGANALFFLDRGGAVGLVLASAYGWLQAATLLLVPYVLTALTLWGLPVLPALRRSFLLAVGRPQTALALGLGGALLAAGAAVTGIGLVGGLVSAWALLAVTVVARQAARSAGQPLAPAPRRSWRELLRPWETE